MRGQKVGIMKGENNHFFVHFLQIWQAKIEGEKFFSANKNLGCFAQNSCNVTKLLRFSVTPRMPLLMVCQQPLKSYISALLKSPILINTAKSKPFILKFQLRTYPSCTAPNQGRKKFWKMAEKIWGNKIPASE